jgi:uncharacterized heparinase superfamily protein
VGHALWRRGRRRLRAGPTYRWRYAGRTPERILVAPPDLRIADPQTAIDIYHGRFPFAGHVVETSGQSPFQLDVSNPAWLESLHGFRWLRHMREAGTDLAAANARALVTEWIAAHGGRIAGLAWDPAVTSRRVIAWLQHSAVVLHGADYPFYRSFLKLLAVQIRYLRIMAPEMAEGEERLRARIALTFAALSLPASASALRNAVRNLSDELERQILPDGGHISRNPAVILELLADLLPLRQTFANQAEALPPALMGAIDRMLPALRFFRHQDGTLAHFNGVGVTIHNRIAAVLRHDDTIGQPLMHAPHSGYERMVAGGTTVIADTGPPPPAEVSRNAQAGCLSFELSSGRQLFIVNAGVDSFGARDFRPLSRATAAHSTATINDASSCRFNLSARLERIVGTAMMDGPKHVTCERIETGGGHGFVASHDGYLARFGLLHERQLMLSADGGRLDGSDRFFGSGGQPPSGRMRDFVALRFHLHPDTRLSRDEAGHLRIEAARGGEWAFSCSGVEPEAEDSIFFAGLAGPQRSRQIVLNFRASEIPEIAWRLTRLRAIQPG